MNQISVVTVANENAEPVVVYEVRFDDGIRTPDEAAKKAIEHAKSLGDSYKFVAVGETNESRSQRLRAIDVMLNNIWLNGFVTSGGNEWFN